MSAVAVALSLSVVTALTASCSSSGPADATTTSARPAAITVAAAASLTEAFTAITEQFRAANPGVEVTLSFDSSGALARQITEGAPIDVFASADTTSMDTVSGPGLVDQPVVFASNRLALVTKPGNPLGIDGVGDLGLAATVSLCVPSAPCGALADRLLADVGARLDESKVTRGQNVKATLRAVTEGDADAALVYATDAGAAGDRVSVVAIPDSTNLTTDYPLAVVADTPQRTAATAFVAFVIGPEGRAVLRDSGFVVR